jgi:hypothetical protein
MIQLTQKGKEIYGDNKIEKINVYVSSYGIDTFNVEFGYIEHGTQYIIASTPIEMNALLDIGLIEIK